MISFITWVNNAGLYDGLKRTAERTCREVELVPIGQEVGSLAHAYNLGTSRAKGDILVYCHQDVRIMDFGFTRAVEHILADDKAGFAGPIGSTGLSKENWWDVPNQVGWVIRGDGFFWGHCAYDGPVRQIDGLLMATKRRFEFPVELPGVHFLDMWMCRLAESMGYENRVFSAAVQHLSDGNEGCPDYVHNRELYQRKWGLL